MTDSCAGTDWQTDPVSDVGPVRICFVCLGNICRSPSAEGVMAKLVADAGLAGAIELDSAGTGGWHVGDPPDERAIAAAGRRGIDLRHLRGRQVHAGDFAWFDLLVAMDRRNLGDLHDLAPDPELRPRAVLLRSFDPASSRGPGGRPADPDRGELDVPDPYYGGPDGFDHVLDLLEAACTGLLDHVRATLLADR